MEFEWDEKKAITNIQKHGLDFEDAIFIFDGFVYEDVDDRYDYGEARFVALGMVDGRVIVVIYTDRNDVRRIISARKANANEQRAYHKALAQWSTPDG